MSLVSFFSVPFTRNKVLYYLIKRFEVTLWCNERTRLGDERVENSYDCVVIEGYRIRTKKSYGKLSFH